MSQNFNFDEEFSIVNKTTLNSTINLGKVT